MKKSKNVKEDIRSELESVAPLLANMHGQSDGFEVPPNYFRQLSDALTIKLGEPEESQSNWVNKIILFLQSLFQTRRVYAIATIALLAIAGFWIVNKTNNLSEDSFDQLSLEDIQGYIESNIDDFELELFSDMASSDQEGFDPAIQTDVFDDDELGEYLDELINDLEVDDFEDLL